MGLNGAWLKSPISFTFSLLLLTIAIFEYNFLEAAPIALQKIVDRISDSYVVLEVKSSTDLINSVNKIK